MLREIGGFIMGLDMYLYDKSKADLGYWRKANHIHMYVSIRKLSVLSFIEY